MTSLSVIKILSVVALLVSFGYATVAIWGIISRVIVQFDLSIVFQGWYVGCALAGLAIGVLCEGIEKCFGRKDTLLPMYIVGLSVSRYRGCLNFLHQFGITESCFHVPEKRKSELLNEPFGFFGL